MLTGTMQRTAPVLFLVAVLAFLVACSPARVAEKKVVQVSYTLTVDGAVFAQSEKDQPLEFMVGAGRMPPAFETEITGLRVGEKKTFLIKSDDAYGPYDKEKLVEVPLSEFGSGEPPKVGDRFSVQTPAGTMPIVVSAVNEKTVTVDFNSPLAGKDLSFDVQIVKIRDATAEELQTAQAESQATPQ
jgi:FKBP-type peptidyl-prolyl cis-trans isomerase 2